MGLGKFDFLLSAKQTRQGKEKPGGVGDWVSRQMLPAA